MCIKNQYVEDEEDNKDEIDDDEEVKVIYSWC